MKEILQTIILNLVDNKEAVEIKEIQGEKSIVLEVKVADSDMGKVIGKQGRLARAIPSVVKAAPPKDNRKVDVEIV